MKQEQLNDELTVVGLVLRWLLLAYYITTFIYSTHRLHIKVIEAQTVAIMLNNELAKAEFQLTENRSKLETIQNQVEESALITRIIKDLATSWNSRRKD